MCRFCSAILVGVAFALVVPLGATPAVAQAAKGAIVAVGGGGTTPDIVNKTLALAGGKDAIVAVLPQSSALENAGESSVKMWLDAGAKSASKVLFDDRAIIFRGTGFEVVGKSSVLVVDPRGVTRENAAAGELVAGTGLELAVLRHGITYSLQAQMSSKAQ